MSELTAWLMTVDAVSAWVLVLIVLCFAVPMLIGWVASKGDATQERRETERGGL